MNIQEINKEIEEIYERNYFETDSLGSKRYLFDDKDFDRLQELKALKEIINHVPDMYDKLQPIIDLVALESKKWWLDLETGKPKDRNIAEVLCLIHSEISEAMEGYRKNLQDDKLPHRKMIEVELADAVIRIFDLCGQKGYDLVGAIRDKMEYNRHREDHKRENRLKENGKKF